MIKHYQSTIFYPSILKKKRKKQKDNHILVWKLKAKNYLKRYSEFQRRHL